MYNRQAKGIKEETWAGLMDPTDWKEIRDVITSNKSAGLDGVNCDLVEIHSEAKMTNHHHFWKSLHILSTPLFVKGEP